MSSIDELVAEAKASRGSAPKAILRCERCGEATVHALQRPSGARKRGWLRCMPCHAAAEVARQKDPDVRERKRAADRANYQKNREARRRQVRDRYWSDVEAGRRRNREAGRRWRARNREQSRLDSLNRRTPLHSDWLPGGELWDGLCIYCMQPLGELWHREHIVPRSRMADVGAERSDADVPGNIAPACKQCNHGVGGKWAMLPGEWRQAGRWFDLPSGPLPLGMEPGDWMAPAWADAWAT